MRTRLPWRTLGTVALIASAGGACAGQLVGKVVSVHDGDTLTVLIERKQVRIRLADIDAPELGQAFGRRSRESLAQLCAGHVAQVAAAGRDKYKRVLGRVACGGVNANAEQVRLGMAWVFDRYVTDRSLYGLQNDARASRRGLWTEPQPVAPWDWRGRKKLVR